MKRLGSEISLALSASLVMAFTYWYGGLQAKTLASQPTIVANANAEQTPAPKSGRKILYYRNPMGAPDTSPVPKKDPMGMDYIPVYADEQDDPGTVRVSLDKVQRIGVRTEKARSRSIVQQVRAVGRVEHDEALLTIVALTASSKICSSTRPASTSRRASRCSGSTARRSNWRSRT
jgi:Cu(I)/Ag(I) efflux system membrane fusion protein